MQGMVEIDERERLFMSNARRLCSANTISSACLSQEASTRILHFGPSSSTKKRRMRLGTSPLITNLERIKAVNQGLMILSILF